MNPPEVPGGSVNGEGGEAAETEEEDEQGKKRGVGNNH